MFTKPLTADKSSRCARIREGRRSAPGAIRSLPQQSPFQKGCRLLALWMAKKLRRRCVCNKPAMMQKQHLKAGLVYYEGRIVASPSELARPKPASILVNRLNLLSHSHSRKHRLVRHSESAMAQGDNYHEDVVAADKHSDRRWRVRQNYAVNLVSQLVPIMLFLWR